MVLSRTESLELRIKDLEQRFELWLDEREQRRTRVDVECLPLVYVMSPYTASDRTVELHRYYAVRRYIHLMMAWSPEFIWYSPIVYCHPIALEVGLPTDAEYWRKFNNHFILHCLKAQVLCLDGWQESKGITWSEIPLLEELGKSIEYVTPAAEIHELARSIS